VIAAHVRIQALLAQCGYRAKKWLWEQAREGAKPAKLGITPCGARRLCERGHNWIVSKCRQVAWNTFGGTGLVGRPSWRPKRKKRQGGSRTAPTTSTAESTAAATVP